jgi:hypothetical protein
MFLILHSLFVSAQIKLSDGSILTRNYAEFIAAKFDSLDTFKSLTKDCFNILDNTASALDTAKAVIKSKDIYISVLKSEISLKSEMIKSFERTEFAYIDIQKRYKGEVRKKKAWKITALATIATTLLTTTIILLK